MSGAQQGWETPRQHRRGRGVAAAAVAGAVLAALVLSGLADGEPDGGLEVAEADADAEAGAPTPTPSAAASARGPISPRTPPSTPRAATPRARPREEPPGAWREIASAPIAARSDALGIWTGEEVLVWGGWTAGGEPLADGAAYDPLNDRWRGIAAAPRAAPAPHQQAAVWTGTEMVVLGPRPPLAYRPATDTWRDLPAPPEPPGSWWWASAGWAGGLVVARGGAAEDGGGVAMVGLDPERDAWQELPPPPVDGWDGPVSLSADGGLVVAGSVGGSGDARPGITSYDFSARTWSEPDPVPDGEQWFPAPLRAAGPERLIGLGRDATGSALARSWSPETGWRDFAEIPTWLLEQAPPEAFWTGDALLVVHGDKPGTGALLSDGRPGRGRGEITRAPRSGREGVTVWTGDELVVWGGGDGAGELSRDGAAFDPTGAGRRYAAAPEGVDRLEGTWRRVPEAPIVRDNPSLDWTGEQLLVWGGAEGRYVPSGAAYDPAGDTWTAIPDAPVAGRQHHVSAWTGTELLVWSGIGLDDGMADGAAYDPGSGRWRALPEAPLDAPHRAVGAWTGRELLVVAGGVDAGAAAYDPAGDRWRRLPDPPRHGHRLGAVWTGTELVVVSDALDGTVARFDPARDAWTAGEDRPELMPSSGVEVGWTGTEVLLWGGSADAPARAGWAYRPGQDTWRRLPDTWLGGTLVGAGSVWTGEHWVVLGSGEGGLPALAAYEPARDRWLALPRPGGDALTGPLAWTGSEVVAWSMFGDALAFRPDG